MSLYYTFKLIVKPLKVYQDLQDITVMLGQPIKLHCEIYPGNVPGRWYRNGQLIQPNDRINIIHRNKYVISTIVSLFDNSFTQMLTNTILFFSGSIVLKLRPAPFMMQEITPLFLRDIHRASLPKFTLLVHNPCGPLV